MYDFHIHSKYSSCSRKHGEYNLIEAYNVVKSRGFDGMGISDHCNYKGYKKPNIFLDTQKHLINKNGLENKLLLGLEISIINQKGDLGVDSRYLEKLDYYIISEHCHLSRLFSDFYRLKDKFVHWMSTGNIREIQKSVDFLTNLMVNGINKNPRSIFAHIWRFTRGRACLSNYTLEKTEEILEALQTNEVAFELHSGILSLLMISNELDEKLHQNNLKKVHTSLHSDILTPKNYVHEIFKLLPKYDLYYSLGSDAHKLNDVGKFGIIENAEELSKFLNSINIPEKRIIKPDFFSDLGKN